MDWKQLKLSAKWKGKKCISNQNFSLIIGTIDALITQSFTYLSPALVVLGSTTFFRNSFQLVDKVLFSIKVVDGMVIICLTKLCCQTIPDLSVLQCSGCHVCFTHRGVPSSSQGRTMHGFCQIKVNKEQLLLTVKIHV